jgi:uncharacterized protein YyaL (SSP411 family)
LLGAEQGEIFCEFFNITEGGNFEHNQSIVNKPLSEEEFAAKHNLSLEDLNQILTNGKKTLFYKRVERVRPALDNKILTAWNGLMLTAFAEAANILGRDDYRLVAERNADFILNSLTRDGRLLRTYKEGQAKLNGYVEDYAYVIEGLLATYEATFDFRYFTQAKELSDRMIQLFWDERDGGFYFTSSDHEELLTRTKDYFDNAIPSGNSVAALALQRLSILTGDTSYQSHALKILRTVWQLVSQYPTAFGYMLCAMDFYLSDAKEIALVGDAESHEIRLFMEEIYSHFIPNKVIALQKPEEPEATTAIKLLEGKTAIEDKPTAYVCRNYTCLAPVTTPAELTERLGQ